MPKKIDELIKCIDELNGKFGAGTIMSMGKAAKPVSVETISTGLPSLDLILGKGIPKGRLVEIYGLESSGKTTMSLHMIAKCQGEGKKALFIDVEHSFDPEYAKKMGVDMEELFLSQPDSGEQALSITEKMAESGHIGVIVIDSVSALIPQSEDAKEIDGTQGMASRARMLSSALPKIVRAASKGDCVVIFINQVRMNIGVMYGNPEVTPGGLAMKFFTSIRMRVSASKAEERNGEEGSPVKVVIKKNKVGIPFQSTELFLVYGKGFDVLSDLLECAKVKGIVKNSGSFYYFIWDEETKYHGETKLREFMASSPETVEKLKKVLETGEIS